MKCTAKQTVFCPVVCLASDWL